MNKAKLNYWIDLVIALAFVLSAASGIVFLFPPGNATALGVSYRIWDLIHVWGSLLMIAGVLAHLVLHWKWIVAMTKKTFLPQATSAHARTQPVTANESAFAGRRNFLRAAGVSTIALGAAAIGYRSLFGSQSAAASQALAGAEALESTISIPLAATPTATSAAAQQVVQPVATMPGAELTTESVAATELILVPTSTPAATATAAPTATTVQQTQQKLTVACPKGLTYDAFPGRCRHYVDRDGDGYCDYSIPTAG